MHISKRISDLEASPTVALNAKAQQLKSEGIDVLNFTVGEPDYPTPKSVVDVGVKALTDGKTGYGPAGGGLAFRKAISEKLKRDNNLTFTPDQIVCGIGAKEILFHIFLATLNEGDEVLLSAPAWVSYKEHVKAAGAIPVMIPMPNGDPSAIIAPDLLEKHATPKTVAYILCSPNNPAGYSLNRSEMQTLGNYLEKKDWWIITDEIYEYLVFEGEHISLLQTNPALSDRCILVNGLSKAFAMTGWRVGYAAGPKEVINLVKTLQSHSSTCLPPFIEEAGTFAISQGKPLMSREIEGLKEKRDLAIQKAESIPKLSYIKPQGAFYIFLDLREILKTSTRFGDLDSMAFCQYLLEEYHVAVVPGEAFDCPGYLRLSYATKREIIEDGFERLKKALANI